MLPLSSRAGLLKARSTGVGCSGLCLVSFQYLQGCGLCNLSEHPLLKAKQPQLFQPHLVHLILQSRNYLSGPSMDLLQHVPLFLVLGSPELDTALKMWDYQPFSCGLLQPRAPHKDPEKWMTHLFKLVPAILLPLEECSCEELAVFCCKWWGGWHFLPDLWLQLESSLSDGL